MTGAPQLQSNSQKSSAIKKIEPESQILVAKFCQEWLFQKR